MENKVLAVVAGKEITSNEVTEIISKYPQQQQAMLDNEQGRKNVLEQIVGFELIYNFAKETELDKTEEFKSQMERLQKEFLTQMMMNKILSEVTVTEDEAKKHYEENTQMFSEPENVSAKHILTKTEEDCKKIKEEITSGAISFEEAARKYSECPSKDNNGDLGAFARGMMVPEFEEVAFNLTVGEVSDVVKTQFGYHLIKVEEKNEASVQNFDEIKDGVINQLIRERQERKYLDLIKDLRGKYSVEMK